MTISYTGNLKLALPITGTEAGTWGDVVNQQITSLLDQSVAGTVSLTSMTNADYTLTNGNGSTANEARYMALLVPATLTLTVARNIIVPTSSKAYIIRNLSTGGFAVTLKTSGGTGISVPNGKTMALYCDGTNVIDGTDYLSSLTLGTALPVLSGGTGVTTSTGTGSVVLNTSPTLITPALGTPTALVGTNITGTAAGLTAGNVTTNANLTGAITSVGNATSLGSFTSAQLAAALTDETGSGAAVFANSPTFITPALGTPTALVGTNITGTAAGLTAGNVTTNANLTGAVTSTGNATLLGSFTSLQLSTALTDETGSGAAVFGTSPTLVTPILGTPQSVTLTNATGLPISTGVSGLGTGVATALAVNVGTAGAPVVNGGVLGTPSSGTVTNLTGTASININGTVGATTPTTGAFTTGTFSSTLDVTGEVQQGGSVNHLLAGGSVAYEMRGNANGAETVYGNSTGTGKVAVGYLQTNDKGYVYSVAPTLVLAAGNVETVNVTSTGLAVTGTLSATGGVTLSGGTANGVAYLNGSKVLTTGSALTFDGTNFATTGGITAGNNVIVNGGSIQARNGIPIYLWNSDLTNWATITGVGASGAGNPALAFGLNAVGEQMRLTSTGLGIGTSSPGEKLQVNGNIQNSAGQWIGNSAGASYLPDDGVVGGSIRNGGSFFITTGGAERFRIDASGNLGIGTSSPRALLDLNTTRSVKAYWGTAGTLGETQSTAADYFANNLFVSAESAGTMTYTKTTGDSGNAILQDFNRGITFYTGVTGAATTTGTLNSFERMRLDSSGNLGIGTSSPISKLQANKASQTPGGAVPSGALIISNSAAGNGCLEVGNDSSANSWIQSRNTTTASYYDLLLNPSGGNVGIGTSSPTKRLDIRQAYTSDTVVVQIGNINNGNGATPSATLFDFTVNNGTPVSRIGSVYTQSIGQTYLSFSTYGSGLLSERMVIDSSGNLGLGVTPSASPACVNLELPNGSTLSSRSVVPQFAMMTNAVGDWYGATYKTTAPANMYLLSTGQHNWYNAPSGTAGAVITFTQAMTLDASGNLLVGTTSFASSNSYNVMLSASQGAGYFQHSGAAASGSTYCQFNYAGTNIGSITQSGTTAVLYNTTSDQRLKSNIVDAPDASALIDAIQVRSFDWKADGSRQRYGFVAQELVAVAPEAVHAPADPDEMMAVDYSKLVPMLVKEIQSLRARVAQLESKP